MPTQADVAAARSEGIREGLKTALSLAKSELKGAKAELDHASKTKNFAPNTIERTRVRRETAQRIVTAIKKLI